MTSLRGCSRCKDGWMSWDQILCNECSGENSRKSYRSRVANLAECLNAAAIEELRFRATEARLTSPGALADLTRYIATRKEQP